MPGAAFAAILFAISRALRWRPDYLVALAESAVFGLFLWIANAVANLLYQL